MEIASSNGIDYVMSIPDPAEHATHSESEGVKPSDTNLQPMNVESANHTREMSNIRLTRQKRMTSVEKNWFECEFCKKGFRKIILTFKTL